MDKYLQEVCSLRIKQFKKLRCTGLKGYCTVFFNLKILMLKICSSVISKLMGNKYKVNNLCILVFPFYKFGGSNLKLRNLINNFICTDTGCRNLRARSNNLTVCVKTSLIL
jgi:hypothetical protein